MNEDKLTVREGIAFVMGVIGFVLLLGTVGEYEFSGFMESSEFLMRTGIGLALLFGSIPVSGDLDELLEQISEKKKNR